MFFTSSPFLVVEGKFNIVLNLKGVRIRMSEQSPFLLPIDVEGVPGKTTVVTAGDIRFTGDAEVLNTDHPIASIDARCALGRWNSM